MSGAKGRTVSCGKEATAESLRLHRARPHQGRAAEACRSSAAAAATSSLVAFDEASSRPSASAADQGDRDRPRLRPGRAATQADQLRRRGSGALADGRPRPRRRQPAGRRLARGAPQNVRLAGGFGDDTIQAGPEDDLLEAGPGADKPLRRRRRRRAGRRHARPDLPLRRRRRRPARRRRRLCRRRDRRRRGPRRRLLRRDPGPPRHPLHLLPRRTKPGSTC